MDYEKRYKEALDRMKSWVKGEHPECFSEAQKAAEFVFPELAESKDERIRKELIQLISYMHDADHRKKDWLAWLEKQGEHKPILDFKASDWHVSKVDGKIHNIYQSVDKDEPKFKVGDWVVFIASESIYQVEKIENYEYTLKHILGGSLCLSFSNEELIREWTIQDAKDGDVLVNGSNIFIFHFINDTRLMGYCHVNIDNGRFYDDIGKNECFCLIDAVVYPATKEQRDTLERAMTNAGYEWDSEKKELKKIEPKTLDPDKVIEWLDEHVPTKFEDMQNYVNQFKKDFGL